jgi:acetate kinase
MPDSPRILALNAGSSSLKWGLFAPDGDQPLQQGEIDWPSGEDCARDALANLLPEIGADEIAAVGHRVVHGASRFTQPTLVTPEVRAAITDLCRLAPLHNPAALAGIDAISTLLPDTPQVAVFDTAFHQKMPPEAFRYPLPNGWYEERGIRRFGFHGINHQWCAERAAALCGYPASPFRVVTCHLGSGCSLAAVLDGRSIDTTMGYTPMDGIAMATRPGALDPGILLALLNEGISPDALADTLNHEAGLKGLSGGTSDMRDLLAAREAGDDRAALAIAVFLHSLRGGIARMAASLGGIDALVFSAGIGEHQPAIRAECCVTLGWMGISLDEAANAAATSGEHEIGAAGAAVQVFVIPAGEEACVARAAGGMVAKR